jgi:prepilin-type N-terminal cleavage/methylation domain-containing protein
MRFFQEEKMRSVREKGFTLVELAVVIVIIGVLAALALPRFRDAVERSKAGESFKYLAAVKSAQERYVARKGAYASAVSLLDIQMQDGPGAVTLLYFDQGSMKDDTTDAASDEDTAPYESGWRLTLTRKTGSGGYGQYTVTFNQDGFINDSKVSTIAKLPAINPLAAGGNLRGR